MGHVRSDPHKDYGKNVPGRGDSECKDSGDVMNLEDQ